MPQYPRKTDPNAPPNYASVLHEVEVHLAAALHHEGIAEPEAKRLTGSVIKGLCRTLGGKQVYFPVGHQRAVAARNALIRAKHDGTTASVRRLAQEYGLSEIHVYRILSQRPGTRCHPK